MMAHNQDMSQDIMCVLIFMELFSTTFQESLCGPSSVVPKTACAVYFLQRSTIFLALIQCLCDLLKQTFKPSVLKNHKYRCFVPPTYL
jgi:hypothetical protein